MEDNPYIAPFATRLSDLREAKSISARQMSLDLGQGHGFINSIETQNSFPSMLTFHFICEALGVTPVEFFEYTRKTPILDRELYEEIQKLDTVSKEYFLKLIRETNNRPK